MYKMHLLWDPGSQEARLGVKLSGPISGMSAGQLLIPAVDLLPVCCLGLISLCSDPELGTWGLDDL